MNPRGKVKKNRQTKRKLFSFLLFMYLRLTGSVDMVFFFFFIAAFSIVWFCSYWETGAQHPILYWLPDEKDISLLISIVRHFHSKTSPGSRFSFLTVADKGICSLLAPSCKLKHGTIVLFHESAWTIKRRSSFRSSWMLHAEILTVKTILIDIVVMIWDLWSSGMNPNCTEVIPRHSVSCVNNYGLMFPLYCLKMDRSLVLFFIRPLLLELYQGIKVHRSL